MPFQLGYVSTASRVMRRDDLIEILRTARRHNDADGVTGLLLFQRGHFLQILEGGEAAVRETFGRIQSDPRHCDIQLLFEDTVGEPQFAEWSMGFQALDGREWLEFPDLDGGTEDLRSVIEHYGRAKELLLLMRRRGLDPLKELATGA